MKSQIFKRTQKRTTKAPNPQFSRWKQFFGFITPWTWQFGRVAGIENHRVAFWHHFCHLNQVRTPSEELVHEQTRLILSAIIKSLFFLDPWYFFFFFIVFGIKKIGNNDCFIYTSLQPGKLFQIMEDFAKWSFNP